MTMDFHRGKGEGADCVLKYHHCCVSGDLIGPALADFYPLLSSWGPHRHCVWIETSPCHLPSWRLQAMNQAWRNRWPNWYVGFWPFWRQHKCPITRLSVASWAASVPVFSSDKGLLRGGWALQGFHNPRFLAFPSPCWEVLFYCLLGCSSYILFWKVHSFPQFYGISLQTKVSLRCRPKWHTIIHLNCL